MHGSSDCLNFEWIGVASRVLFSNWHNFVIICFNTCQAKPPPAHKHMMSIYRIDFGYLSILKNCFKACDNRLDPPVTFDLYPLTITAQCFFVFCLFVCVFIFQCGMLYNVTSTNSCRHVVQFKFYKHSKNLQTIKSKQKRQNSFLWKSMWKTIKKKY